MPDHFSEPAAAPVDLDLRIVTPENVVLSYQLAGPSVRCMAWLIDFAIRLAVMFALIVILSMAMTVLPGLSIGLLLVIWFLNEWGYFTLCEFFFNGKTLGKHALGLRVVGAKGHPVTFPESALRNLLRAVDSMPFLLHGVGFLSMVGSKSFQRLGDRAARTVVITERRVILPREPIILEKIEPLNRSEIGSFVPQGTTLAMIDELLGRRAALSHDRGHAIASRLARVLAQRLHYSGDAAQVTKYPMAFLARVYVTFLRAEKDEDEEEREINRRRARDRRRRVVRAGGPA